MLRTPFRRRDKARTTADAATGHSGGVATAVAPAPVHAAVEVAERDTSDPLAYLLPLVEDAAAMDRAVAYLNASVLDGDPVLVASACAALRPAALALLAGLEPTPPPGLVRAVVGYRLAAESWLDVATAYLDGSLKRDGRAVGDANEGWKMAHDEMRRVAATLA